jgi:RNA recognition motif-containing protein
MSQVPGVLKSKVFIGCVPATVEEAELKQILSRFGKLIGLFYCRDSGASDRGFSIVTYSSETEAAAAISGGNGQSLFENIDFLNGGGCMKNPVTENHLVLGRTGFQMFGMKQDVNWALGIDMIPRRNISIPMEFFQVYEDTI